MATKGNRYFGAGHLRLIKPCRHCGANIRRGKGAEPLCGPCRVGVTAMRATFRGRALLWFGRRS